VPFENRTHEVLPRGRLFRARSFARGPWLLFGSLIAYWARHSWPEPLLTSLFFSLGALALLLPGLGSPLRKGNPARRSLLSPMVCWVNRPFDPLCTIRGAMSTRCPPLLGRRGRGVHAQVNRESRLQSPLGPDVLSRSHAGPFYCFGDCVWGKTSSSPGSASESPLLKPPGDALLWRLSYPLRGEGRGPYSLGAPALSSVIVESRESRGGRMCRVRLVVVACS